MPAKARHFAATATVSLRRERTCARTVDAVNGRTDLAVVSTRVSCSAGAFGPAVNLLVQKPARAQLTGM